MRLQAIKFAWKSRNRRLQLPEKPLFFLLFQHVSVDCPEMLRHPGELQLLDRHAGAGFKELAQDRERPGHPEGRGGYPFFLFRT